MNKIQIKYKPDKPFKRVEDQIETLRNRGLEITDYESAKKSILTHNYYNIINGYKKPFIETKVNGADKYKKGTNFNDLLDLYKFDRSLRKNIFAITLDIECTFYTHVAYAIGERYGHKPQDYLNLQNYKQGKTQKNKKSQRSNLLNRLKGKISDSEIEPLKYYRENYENMPPWILVKGLTFGEVYTLYALSKKEVKDSVIRGILGVKIIDEDLREFFSKMMSVILKYRNWSAHGGRIYNHRCKPHIAYWEPLCDSFGISRADFNKGQGKNDLLALTMCICFFYQENKKSFIEYFVLLNHTFQDFEKSNILTYSQVIKETGLPVDVHSRFLTMIENNEFSTVYTKKYK